MLNTYESREEAEKQIAKQLLEELSLDELALYAARHWLDEVVHTREDFDTGQYDVFECSKMRDRDFRMMPPEWNFINRPDYEEIISKENWWEIYKQLKDSGEI